MVPLALFVLLASCLHGGKWMLVLIAALQTFTFVTSYCIANQHVSDQVNPLALVFSLAAAVIYLAVFGAGVWSKNWEDFSNCET